MCMKTSLVERTPGAGRQANFSSGVASASASNWLDTWRHSPSYPCQIPSGAVCASKGRALNNKRSAKSTFLMVCLVSSSLVVGRLNYGNPFYTQGEEGNGGRVAPLGTVPREGLYQCHPGRGQRGRGRRPRRASAAHLPR